MFVRWILAAFLLMGTLLQSPPRAEAQDYYYGNNADYGYDYTYDDAGDDAEDVSFFYDSLAAYGDWYFTPEYGYVWMPFVDHSQWRPYANDGHWVWSDYGWTWVSDYEWGWATFHYGRWLWLDNAYWVWIPDTVWGPAWVAWRYTDNYVGWSPLPPGAYWYQDYGLELTVSIPWNTWVFVEGAWIIDHYIWHHIVPHRRTKRIYYGSKPSTVYRVSSGHPVCVGVDVHRVTRWVGSPVPRLTINIGANARRPSVRGNVVTLYRPKIHRTTRRVVVAPPASRRVAPASLRRVVAPPPPTRAGVSSSQKYHSRATAHRRATVQRRSTAPVKTDVRVAPSTREQQIEGKEGKHHEIRERRDDRHREIRERRDERRNEIRERREENRTRREIRREKREH